MSQATVSKAENVINNLAGKMEEGYCAIALIDEDGYPSASTVSIAKADGIKWLAFCAGINDNKANRIRKNNRASVCLNSPGYNITLVGTAEVITDPKVKKETWYEGCGEIWPGGADDPDYCVIRFTAKRYNLYVGMELAEGKL